MRTASFARAAVAGGALISVVALASAGCSENPRLTLELTGGGELDALSRQPVPTRLEVEALSTGAPPRPLTNVTLPASSVDLGPIDKGTVLTLRVRGRDVSGRAVVFGQTLPVEVDAPQDVSLFMFVQRTDEFARLPGAISITEPAALVDRLGGRYVVIASGLRAELFDLATFSARQFSLSRIPKTIVATTTALLTLDDGGAAMVDPSGTTTTVAAPSGGVFADVVGGAVLRGEAGVAYVIGATRAGAGAQPSSLVLRVAEDGALSFLRLLQPRVGAAAAYVPGRGLVVVGGSDAGPGVELLGDGGSVALPFAPLPLASGETGLVSVALDERRVLVVGPTLATRRVVDLACPANCAPSVWGDSALRVIDAELESAKPWELARLADGSMLALANKSDGTTRALRLRESIAPVEVATRVSHARARLTPGVGGAVLMIGGAPEIESFAVDPP